MLSDMNTLARGKSRYALVMAAAKRARQLQDGMPMLVEKPGSNKHVCIALEELSAGQVEFKYPAKAQGPKAEEE